MLKFFKEVKAELEKVTWPSFEKALLYTGIVIIISVFTAYYMALFDYIFLKYGISRLIK